MKNWRKADIDHMLSAKDKRNISILLELLNGSGAFDRAMKNGGRNSPRDAEIMKNMIEAAKSHGYPTVTQKQANYAAGMLGRPWNSGTLDELVTLLNEFEQAGTPVQFLDNIAPERRVDVEKAAAYARSTMSVSSESQEPEVTTESINSNWGLF